MMHEDSIRPVRGRTSVTRIECKRHPGTAINLSCDACPKCGVYHGVPENFEVVTYEMVPTAARQCTRRDLDYGV
jgi:hypothetical protein